MTMDKSRFLLITVCALALIGLVDCGIKCWVCNSEHDLGCGDPFDNSSFPITDCDSETKKRPQFVDLYGQNLKPTMCRKVVQKVKGEWRYIRSCAYLGEPGIGGDERFCNRRVGTYDIYVEDCLCRSKDGCNTSSKMDISFVTQAILFLLSFSPAALYLFNLNHR